MRTREVLFIEKLLCKTHSFTLFATSLAFLKISSASKIASNNFSKSDDMSNVFPILQLLLKPFPIRTCSISAGPYSKR